MVWKFQQTNDIEQRRPSHLEPKITVDSSANKSEMHIRFDHKCYEKNWIRIILCSFISSNLKMFVSRRVFVKKHRRIRKNHR